MPRQQNTEGVHAGRATGVLKKQEVLIQFFSCSPVPRGFRYVDVPVGELYRVDRYIVVELSQISLLTPD